MAHRVRINGSLNPEKGVESLSLGLPLATATRGIPKRELKVLSFPASYDPRTERNPEKGVESVRDYLDPFYPPGGIPKRELKGFPGPAG